MISFLGCSDQAIAVANGVTTVALLEHLVAAQDPDACAEVRTILKAGSNASSCARMFEPLTRRSI